MSDLKFAFRHVFITKMQAKDGPRLSRATHNDCCVVPWRERMWTTELRILRPGGK